MLPKALIVLACLYAVKAAVITINAYDDNNNELESQSEDDVRSAFLNAIQPEIEVGFGDADTLDESVRSCTNSQCNSVCRRLGFARGVCISSTVCRCSGRLRAAENDASLGNAIPGVENLLKDDESLDRSVRSCVNSQCNSVCRRLGFARGVCVSSTVCRCSGRLRATEEDAALDDVNPEVENVLDDDETLDRTVRSCVNSQCNTVCRRLGFARGVCVSSTVCRCSGRLRAAEDDAALDGVYPEVENVLGDDETLDRSVRSCVNSQCNNVCRRLGFARGVCVSSTVCRCSGRLRAAEDDAALDDINPEVENVLGDDETLDRSVRSCVNSQCNNVCRRLGFARGVCVSSTVCRCSGRLRAAEDDAALDDVNPEVENVLGDDETLDRSVRSCVNSQCNNVCRRLGFARGVCVSSTVCRCSGRLRAAEDDAALDDVNPEVVNMLGDDESLDKSVRSCVNSQCNSVCRRLGFARGVCVSSTVCRCSGRLRATEDDAALDDVNPENLGMSDVLTPKACNIRSCEQSCRRIGFPGGTCVNGRCKCDIRRLDDQSPVMADPKSDAIADAAKDAVQEENNDIQQN